MHTGGVGKNRFGKGVNDETQKLALHGFDLQDKSKASLQRRLNKVKETTHVANAS